MALWLSDHDIDPVIIDNGSDYPALLEWYKETDFEVVYLNANYGHTCVWMSELNLIDRLEIKGRYIVTDPDLDLTGVPGDFMNVLNKGLNLYDVDKCALSLEIEDLPDSNEGNFIRQHEAKYWKVLTDKNYYMADTDTTFALYREGVNSYSHSAIRSNRPYTAKHVPWYYTDFVSLPEDEKYYLLTASESSSGKKRLIG